MVNLNSVYSRSPDIVTRKTGNEYVLVPVTNNIADMNSIYTLNETGAYIWELIDGIRNVDDIINSLTDEYDIDPETAGQDVISFFENMSNYLIIKI